MASSTFSRRQFLKLAALTASGALLPFGIAGGQSLTPFLASPWQGVGQRAGSDPSSLYLNPSPCLEDLAGVLNLAATAEALAMTFYYRAIVSEFFIRLPTNYQAYFRAALDQERFHYQFLSQAGATPLATAFYFPPRTFGFDDFGVFIKTIERLETEFMSAYLAAARRFTEMGQPVLAEIAGQIIGVEAEHRIIGRELEGLAPPPPNDLCFERTTFECPAQIYGALGLYLLGGAGYQGPFALPSDTEMVDAIQGFTTTRVPFVTATACHESQADIFTIAATAEALGITFYYRAIQGGFFRRLTSARQWYLQAALDEERRHLDFWLAQGATPPPTEFFFPDRVFDDLPLFLATLDSLENAFISAYLAAMQRFAHLGQPLLAQAAGQILGVEAEHRILGRIIADQSPPNDRVLQRASFTCLADAATTLAPFLQGNATHTLTAPLPSVEQITTAVDRFGCTPVPTAAYRVFFPQLAYKPPTRR